jgi:chemotaxis protein histidine kinase CheA
MQTATERSIAFVSIDRKASPQEVKALVSKLQCTVFVNVVSDIIDIGKWRHDEENATTLLHKIVPDDFSAQVARQLAIMWPKAANYKIQVQEAHGSSHAAITCFEETTGTRVFNVAIGKLSASAGIEAIMKQCGKHPTIIGGGIEAIEHLLAMYVKENKRSDARILTTGSQNPACKCILLTPGMEVKRTTSPTTSPTINVIPLTLQPLRLPEHGRPQKASHEQPQKASHEQRATHAKSVPEHRRPQKASHEPRECKVSHEQPQKASTVDANSATSSSHQQRRPHATEHGRPQKASHEQRATHAKSVPEHRRPQKASHEPRECKVSHEQPQKASTVDANSATSSSHQQRRPRATEPGRPERELSNFGALGDPDMEDVFVALLASILKEACPRLSSTKLEKATRKAVQRNPLLADDKAAPVIRSGVSRSWFYPKVA